MKILLDANVIVGLSEKARRPVISDAIKRIHQSGHAMVVVPQVLYEFWVVATRPAKSRGLGLSTEIAAGSVESTLRMFPLMGDSSEIYSKWFEIVRSNRVAGKQAHDARLVAAITAHKLDAIMTSNAKDFKRYSGLNVINPDDMAGSEY